MVRYAVFTLQKINGSQLMIWSLLMNQFRKTQPPLVGGLQ